MNEGVPSPRPSLLTERLSTRQDVLDAIENVFRLEKGTLESQEELTHVAQARHYDPQLARKSYRDGRLWKRGRDGEVGLEKMYDRVPIESLDTYENRFASFLLDLVRRELEEGREALRSPDALAFLTTSPSFGRYGTFSLLARYLREERKEEREDLVLLLSRLEQQASLLTRAEVYRKVPHVLFDDVEETNLLCQQRDYRKLLNFYRRRQSEEKEAEERFHQVVRDCLKEFFPAVEEKRTTVRTEREGIEFLFSFADAVHVHVKERQVEARYLLRLNASLLLPSLELLHEGERRTLPLMEGRDLADLLSSLLLVLPAGEKGICPVCQSPLGKDRCPVCHAAVRFDPERPVVTNAPFLRIGGQP